MNNGKNSRKNKPLLWVIKVVTRYLFNADIETLKVPPQPFLILSNHNTDYDCAFIALAAQAPVSFVATENILRIGLLGRIAMRFFTPIVHYKGTMGVATSKRIIREIREGKNIAMFPEGHRSFNGATCPIPPATAKLARMCGGTLVTYRMEGGYLSSPRWSSTLRKGRITGRVAGIYTHEMLAEMSDQEISDAIVRDLQTDAYKEQEKKPVAFKGKRMAENLESTLSLCPECGRIGTLSTRGSRLFCACGFSARFDEYGMLKTDRTAYTIRELDEKQRRKIGELLAESVGKVIFADEVKEQFINERHEAGESRRVTLNAYADSFVTDDLIIPFEKITGISINQQNLFLLHSSDFPGHLEISGPGCFNALKYLYLYRAACGSQNGLL